MWKGIKNLFGNLFKKLFVKSADVLLDKAMDKIGVPESIQNEIDIEDIANTIENFGHKEISTDLIDKVTNPKSRTTTKTVQPGTTATAGSSNVTTIPNYFKPEEFVSKTDKGMSVDKLTMDPTFLSMLNMARHIAGNPWKVNSGQRSVEYNKAVGGVNGSAHVKGLAADISAPSGAKKFEVVSCAAMAGFKRIGIGKTFVHLDNDTSKPKPTIFLYS